MHPQLFLKPDVDANHLMSFGEQAIGEVTSNKAGKARDHHPHGGSHE
jgi:hypothetical protein